MPSLGVSPHSRPQYPAASLTACRNVTQLPSSTCPHRTSSPPNLPRLCPPLSANGSPFFLVAQAESQESSLISPFPQPPISDVSANRVGLHVKQSRRLTKTYSLRCHLLTLSLCLLPPGVVTLKSLPEPRRHWEHHLLGPCCQPL